MLRRQSWRPHQRKQHSRSRYARERMLRRGLRTRHGQKAHTGTYEAHQRPAAGHRWGGRSRGKHKSPPPGWGGGRPLILMELAEEKGGWGKRGGGEGRQRSRGKGG